MNQFDHFALDIGAVYRKTPIRSGKLHSDGEITRDPWSKVAINFYPLYRFPLLPLKARRALWHVLRRVSLDQMWFERFRGYWSEVLGARPMWSPQDLYFLRNIYRMRFQDVGFDGDESVEGHLRAWQKPEVIYQLLHLVFRESIGHELEALKLFRAHAPANPRRIVEYGCATAPVTTTFFEFTNASRLEFHLYDLPTVSLHYAAYKFRQKDNVTITPIETDTGLLPRLPESCDAVFCITVFEHLNEPLKVAENFHRALKPGGLLFFDYIKGDADGLDTQQGAAQRDSVLDFMAERFDVLHGKLDRQDTMGLTLIRKKK